MPTGLKGYLIDFNIPGTGNPTKSIEFLYYDDISSSVDPVYEEAVVRGRSEEHLFYSHTSGEELPMKIRLVASVDELDNGTTKKIWDDWLFIKSFAFPGYGASGRGPITPPRKVRMVIGTWLKEDGVIKQPMATFIRPYDESGYPQIIDVSFTFRIINRKPRSYIDIRQGGSSGRQQ